MTIETNQQPSAAADDGSFAGDTVTTATLGSAFQDYINRLRGGDMRSLPAVLGLIVLVVIFSFASDTFTTRLNIANLMTQAGPICVLALGLIPVLLLGEIDLSAGVAGSTGAMATSLLIVDHGQGWVVATLAGLAVGAVIGLAIGLLVARLGIPSFVVTLAFFLGLQGVMLKFIGQGGSVRFNDEVLRGLAIKNIDPTAGWIGAAIIVVVFAVLSLRTFRIQVAQGLQHPPMSLVLIRIGLLAAVLVALVGFMNQNRSRNPNFPIEGVPRMLIVVVVLLILWTFILTRTRYGRHIYAVGGNAEAARRAGINVARIRTLGVHLLLDDGRRERPPARRQHRQGLPRLGRRQRAAVRRGRGRHRRDQPLRREGPRRRRRHRWPGHRDDHQRTAPAQQREPGSTTS